MDLSSAQVQVSGAQSVLTFSQYHFQLQPVFTLPVWCLGKLVLSLPKRLLNLSVGEALCSTALNPTELMHLWDLTDHVRTTLCLDWLSLVITAVDS